jgi:pathogenesis-related protein 1
VKATYVCVIGLVVVCFGTAANASNSMAQEMTAAHNSYRARVGSPPLTWSESLATRAQKWARSLVERGAFAHQDGQFGENLFEISGGHATPASVVGAWMSEETNYSRETNSCKARCGHYTQVVWHNTKFVGCGVAGDAKREVWVCDYDPPGNIVGERPY